LTPEEYVSRKNGAPYVKQHFYKNPKEYKSIFGPYTEIADIMINGIYWDNDAPAFFSIDDMKTKNWKIKVIADVTCDIAPVSSIPSTLFASTIADPIFGFDPKTGSQSEPHGSGIVDMMTIDNLPNELPRDASKAFGEMFTKYVLNDLEDAYNSKLLKGSMIASEGKLGPNYKYLSEDYVNEKVEP